jgi:hypothetical protein
MRFPSSLVALLLAVTAAGCSSLYYGTLERFGYEKRHILADRVEDGRDAQRDAQEQFENAFERFKSVTRYEGGDLEDAYRSLDREYQRSEARADAVRDEIRSIEEVAVDLFEEWEDEIGQISRADLRRRSAEKLAQTRSRYERLIASMKRAERKMDPVLTASIEIQDEVDALIRDMQKSIREADAFLAELETA